MRNTMNRRYLTTKETLAYALAAGGEVLSSSFLGLYVTYFFVSIFNIDAKLVASVLFFIGIWDAVNDPMMGALIDKTRTRYGKLKPYLVTAPLPMMLSTILLFAGPLILNNEGPDSAKKVIFMTVTYFFVEWFMTMTDVPLWSFSAVISPSPVDRSYVISWGRFCNYLIGNIPVICVPIFIDLSVSGKLGVSLKVVFFVMAVVFAVVGMGLYFFGALNVKERVVQNDEKPPKVIDSIKYLFSNKYLLTLVAFNFLTALTGFSGVFTTYYYIDVLGSMTVSLLIGTPGTIISFLSYLYVPALQKKFSNKQLLTAAIIWNCIANVILYIVGSGRADKMSLMVPALMIQGVTISFFLGIRSIIPTQMACDTIDYMEWKTGTRSEGMTFAAINFITKTANNIARSIGLYFLSAIGYVASNTDAHAIQSAATKDGIWMMYTIVPNLLGLIAVIPLIFYKLSPEKLKQINRDLDERRTIRDKSEEQSSE